MAVADELAGLRAAGAPSGPEDHVVEPQLEEPQQVFAGHAVGVRRLVVQVAELLLEQAVDALGLLLLAQLKLVFLGAHVPVAAVHAGRVGPALDRALHRVTLGALEEELHLLAPAKAADGSGVSRHQFVLDPTPLLRAAAVVGDGGDVFDPRDLEARVLQRPNSRLAT